MAAASSTPSPSKRREMDIMKLMMSDYKVHIPDEARLHDFWVIFHGPAETPYEGGQWRVHVTLPSEYPFRSPSIGFMNRLFHPNVDEMSGSVCLDVINQAWSPMYDLINVFDVFLPQLLRYPNPSDPLNGEAANLLLRDPEKYKLRVKDYVQRYASAVLHLNDEDDDDDGHGGCGGSGSGGGRVRKPSHHHRRGRHQAGSSSSSSSSSSLAGPYSSSTPSTDGRDSYLMAGGHPVVYPSSFSSSVAAFPSPGHSPLLRPQQHQRSSSLGGGRSTLLPGAAASGAAAAAHQDDDTKVSAPDDAATAAAAAAAAGAASAAVAAAEDEEDCGSGMESEEEEDDGNDSDVSELSDIDI